LQVGQHITSKLNEPNTVLIICDVEDVIDEEEKDKEDRIN